MKVCSVIGKNKRICNQEQWQRGTEIYIPEAPYQVTKSDYLDTMA